MYWLFRCPHIIFPPSNCNPPCLPSRFGIHWTSTKFGQYRQTDRQTNHLTYRTTEAPSELKNISSESKQECPIRRLKLQKPFLFDSFFITLSFQSTKHPAIWQKAGDFMLGIQMLPVMGKTAWTGVDMGSIDQKVLINIAEIRTKNNCKIGVMSTLSLT